MNLEPNEILQNARIRCGLTEAEVAAKASMPVSSYYDLEWYDDEIYSVPSLLELFTVCKILGISIMELFPVSDPLDGSLEVLISRLESLQAERGWTRDELSSHVGWTIDNVLREPLSILSEYTVDALRDMSKCVDMRWEDVLFSIWTKVKS